MVMSLARRICAACRREFYSDAPVGERLGGVCPACVRLLEQGDLRGLRRRRRLFRRWISA